MKEKVSHTLIKAVTRSETSNIVARNTYSLLAMTILFSAFTALVAISTNFMINPNLGLLLSIGLIFAIQQTKNSAWGILWVFAFTGLMGGVIAPICQLLLSHYQNGQEIIISSLGLTGVIFLTLSSYVWATKKNFSYLEGFLVIGISIAAFVALMSIVFNFAISTLLYSAFMVLISSGWILFDTHRIVNSGEQNYIIATINIYLDLFNLFINLLRILALFAGKKNE